MPKQYFFKNVQALPMEVKIGWGHNSDDEVVTYSTFDSLYIDGKYLMCYDIYKEADGKEAFKKLFDAAVAALPTVGEVVRYANPDKPFLCIGEYPGYGELHYYTPYQFYNTSNPTPLYYNNLYKITAINGLKIIENETYQNVDWDFFAKYTITVTLASTSDLTYAEVPYDSEYSIVRDIYEKLGGTTYVEKKLYKEMSEIPCAGKLTIGKTGTTSSQSTSFIFGDTPHRWDNDDFRTETPTSVGAYKEIGAWVEENLTHGLHSGDIIKYTGATSPKCTICNTTQCQTNKDMQYQTYNPYAGTYTNFTLVSGKYYKVTYCFKIDVENYKEVVYGSTKGNWEVYKSVVYGFTEIQESNIPTTLVPVEFDSTYSIAEKILEEGLTPEENLCSVTTVGTTTTFSFEKEIEAGKSYCGTFKVNNVDHGTYKAYAVDNTTEERLEIGMVTISDSFDTQSLALYQDGENFVMK